MKTPKEKIQWLIDQTDRGRGEYTDVLKSLRRDLEKYEVPEAAKKIKKSE